ncbi:hypothetical protein ACF0H5_005513 [Mactra antiquata]
MDGKMSMAMTSEGQTTTVELVLISEGIHLETTGFYTIGQVETGLTFKSELDVHYLNKEEENVTRRKRSLSYMYKKFKELKKEAKKKLREFKELIGNEDVDKPENIVGNQDVSTDVILPDDEEETPLPTSIWDLKEFHAYIHIDEIIKPIYAEGAVPGSDRPTENEVVGVIEAGFPWNGGYGVFKDDFSMGMQNENTLRNYKFWTNDKITMTMYELDGSPMVINGEEVVYTQHCNFYVDRALGRLFNFSWSFHDQDVDLDYEILFNWDAPGHHEPLIHVLSKATWRLVPFFTHHFEEIYTYEKDHVKHTLTFEHEMLNLDIQTDVDFRRSLTVHQLGSVSSQAGDFTGTLKYDNLFTSTRDWSKLTSKVNTGSMSDKTSVCTFLLEEKTFTITSAVIQKPGADAIDLVQTKISLWGNSHFMVTTSWSPDYHEIMENTLRQGLISRSRSLGFMADYIKYNLAKPPSLLRIPFTSESSFSVLRNIFMPGIVDTVKSTDNFMAGVFPLKKRENVKISTRYDLLMESVKRMEADRVEPATQTIRWTISVVLERMSDVLHGLSNVPLRNDKIESILRDQQYSYLIPTPFTFRRNLLDIQLHVGRKQLFYPFYLISQVRGSYEGLSALRLDSLRDKRTAFIFGPSGIYRSMHIKTFDSERYILSAQNKKECSYLLAADVRRKQWSIVLSPDGLTLIATPKTITIGWNKQVYVDNCKIPREFDDKMDDDVTFIKSKDKISIETKYGFSIVCKYVDDVCLIVLESQFRNLTIGLLGNSDLDSYTDKLLPDGQIAKSMDDMLGHYVLSGPDTCGGPGATVINNRYDDSCNDLRWQCEKIWSTIHSKQDSCKLDNSNWKLCNNQLCSDLVRGTCYIKEVLLSECDVNGLIEGEIDRGECSFNLPSNPPSSLGSLDIIYVVSYHDHRWKNKKQPSEYLQSLSNSDYWKQFSDVQIGLVKFGCHWQRGITLNEKLAPEHRNFYYYLDFDWNSVDEDDDVSSDISGFDAIKMASAFPFRLIAHKQIVLVITSDQCTTQSDSLTEITADLLSKNIKLDIISSYKEFFKPNIIGLNADGSMITKRSLNQGNRDLPKDDYVSMVTATGGVIWNLDAISKSSSTFQDRFVEVLVNRFTHENNQYCSAA